MSMANEWKHLEIPFHVIEVATENFKTSIGRGGYGCVFKGKLLVSGKETMVAVKRLDEQYGQGLKEFLTEIQLLSGQQHPNLISLVGYCDEGREKSIVYEFAKHGSLDQYISGTRKTTSPTLTWFRRLKICTDAARGLNHLHGHVGEHQTIIHRDIKSSNILIGENWVGKISDLGLSKLSVRGLVVTNGCGTLGYCDPQYSTTGILTEKSDVYSFGVVLFEVLCGRLCLKESDDGFRLSIISAKYHYKNNSLGKIMDDSLREHMGSYSMTKFSEIAYRCLHDDREQRPSMDVVLKELEEALKYQVESLKKQDQDQAKKAKERELATKKRQDAAKKGKRVVEEQFKNLKEEVTETAEMMKNIVLKPGLTQPVEPLESKKWAKMNRCFEAIEPLATLEPLEPKKWAKMNPFFEPIKPLEPLKPIEPLEPKNWANMNRFFEPLEPLEPLELLEPLEPLELLEPKNWPK